ncbi:hypothetical protein MTsPCn5_19290 [Croceitalea sp. MTPC5]|nr:hypothetical protein MTsPCn5_19290 [Croceitalea sp. MTPC5]
MDEKNDSKKHRYQYKAFFWSLGNKITVQSKNREVNRHSTDIYPNEHEN